MVFPNISLFVHNLQSEFILKYKINPMKILFFDMKTFAGEISIFVENDVLIQQLNNRSKIIVLNIAIKKLA